MAISLFKRSQDGTVGLDIDGRYLAAVQVSGGRLTRVASTQLPEGILADGEVVDRAALSDALRAFAAEADLPKRVRLGVSNQQIVVRMLEMPQIDDLEERTSALRYAAAEAIAMPLEEAVLDHQVAGYVEGPNGTRMQVVVVAARRTMIEEYIAAVKDAGLKPEGVDLDAFALIRVLAGETVVPTLATPATVEPQPLAAETAPLEPEALDAPPIEAYPADVELGLDGRPLDAPTEPYEAPAPVLAESPSPAPAPLPKPAAADASAGADSPQLARVYCHLGGVTQLAIAVGDACYFTRTLSSDAGMDGASSALADEIRLSIDYYMAQPNALPVGDALLSGEGARDDALVADIGARLGISAGVARPLGTLDLSALPAGEDARRYTVAAGLAMGAAA
jgi:Tfp pilus assembly PilM family ATPase